MGAIDRPSPWQNAQLAMMQAQVAKDAIVAGDPAAALPFIDDAIKFNRALLEQLLPRGEAAWTSQDEARAKDPAGGGPMEPRP